MKVIYIIAAILLVIAGSSTWNSAWFQRTAFPEAYWGNMVRSLEDEVVFERSMLRDINLEIEARERTRDLNVKRELNSAKVLLPGGMTIQEARKTVHDETMDLREERKNQRLVLESARERLTAAEREFNKHR